MKKYIFFDLDDTLFDFKKSEINALTNLFKKHKVEKIDEYMKVYKDINKDLWEKLEKKEITREYLVNTRFEKLFNHFNIKVDGIKFAKEYEKLLGNEGSHIQGAEELLKTLKDKNFKLYALTNGITNIQVNRLKNSSIEKFFEKVYISENIGYQKPYKEFFEYVENDIKGFEKEKSIMIGDSLSADILGANNYGIDSIWYNPKEIKNYNENICPTYTVKNYIEILEILLKG